MKNHKILEKGSIHFNRMPTLPKGYAEIKLKPVSLTGVIAPSTERLDDGRNSDYKLIGSNGFEYFLVADGEWRKVLTTYCWEEVRVIGLLDMSRRTLIPQKVYPTGPTGENVIDLAAFKSKKFVRNLMKDVDRWVVAPSVA